MKAEERHELRENDLAGWLQFGLWAFLRQNGSYILLAGALAFLGYTLWQRHKANVNMERDNAFIEFNAAIDPSKEQMASDPKESYQALQLLPQMVEDSKYPEIKVGAAMELAKIYVVIAAHRPSQDQLKMSRESAQSKAFEMYAKVLELKPDDPLIAGKAHLGMAAIYEDKGDWDKAAEEYKKVMEDHKFDGAMGEMAKALKENLDARRNAPRLADYVPMAPTPAATGPLLPGSFGSGGVGPMGPTLLPMGPTNLNSPGGISSPGGMGIGMPPIRPSTSNPSSTPFLPESSTQPK